MLGAEDVRKPLVGPEALRRPLAPFDAAPHRVLGIAAARVQALSCAECPADEVGVAFDGGVRRRRQVAVVPQMDGVECREVLVLQRVGDLVRDDGGRLGVRFAHEERVFLTIVEAARAGHRARFGIASGCRFVVARLGAVHAEGAPALAPLLRVFLLPGDAADAGGVAALEARHGLHAHRLLQC